MVRAVLAVIAGVVAAFVSILVVETIGALVVPAGVPETPHRRPASQR